METEMKTRAKLVFGHAQVYERAARLLNQAGQKDFSMLLPCTVNSALSLELYFKSLHMIDRGSEFRVNGKLSHDFAFLFENLQDKTKQYLIDQFKAAMSARNNTDLHIFKTMHSIDIKPKDLKSHLVEYAKLFIDLRYPYEFTEKNQGKTNGLNVFFPEIRNSVYNTIINLEPAWKN